MVAFFFWVFAIVTLGGALFAVTRRRALACVLGLVVAFVGLAGLYVQLGASFPAALQVMLYAGAIMVLVVFVIMFLNATGNEESPEFSRTGAIVSVLVLVPFAALLIGVISVAPIPAPPPVDPGFGSVRSVGLQLFQTWTYPFEVLSLLLLAAMVAAVLLAKKRLD